MTSLRQFTPARVGLGRSGHSLATRDYLDFQLAHARARDAVHFPLDAISLAVEIEELGFDVLKLRTQVRNREEYLRRPDLGRRLDAASAALLKPVAGRYDVAFVIADGLSALAVHRHAAPLLGKSLDFLNASHYAIAPVTIVEYGRVAVADEIGAILGAALAVIFIGERPGLSVTDSLGVYLTWSPRPGRTDAERNCISNVHDRGLSIPETAGLLRILMESARVKRMSGIGLTIPRLSL